MARDSHEYVLLSTPVRVDGNVGQRFELGNVALCLVRPNLGVGLEFGTGACPAGLVPTSEFVDRSGDVDMNHASTELVPQSVDLIADSHRVDDDFCVVWQDFSLSSHRISEPPAARSGIEAFACGLQVTPIISGPGHRQKQLARLDHPKTEFGQRGCKSALTG